MSETGYLNVAEILARTYSRCSDAGASAKEGLQKLKEVIQEGRELDLETADVVAHEMKEWQSKKVQHIILTGSSR